MVAATLQERAEARAGDKPTMVHPEVRGGGFARQGQLCWRDGKSTGYGSVCCREQQRGTKVNLVEGWR